MIVDWTGCGVVHVSVLDVVGLGACGVRSRSGCVRVREVHAVSATATVRTVLARALLACTSKRRRYIVQLTPEANRALVDDCGVRCTITPGIGAHCGSCVDCLCRPARAVSWLADAAAFR